MGDTRVRQRTAFTIVLIGVFLASPPGLQPVILQIFGWIATGLVVTSTRSFSPTERRPWTLLATAGVLSLTGGIVRTIHGIVTGVDDPVPSPADILFVGAYIAVLACMVVLIRARAARGERGHALDALLPALGFGLTIWVFVLQPYMTDSTHPLDERLLNGFYAVLSMAILTATFRLAIGGGSRPRAYHLLAAAAATLLVSDFLVTVLIALDRDHSLNQYLVIPIFALMGAAATHETAPQISGRPVGDRSRLTRGRLLLLGGSLLFPPAVLLASLTTDNQETIGSLIGGYALLSVLVLVRIVELVRAEERANRREAVLRGTGERLLGASNHSEVRDLLARGAQELLVGRDASVSIATAADDLSEDAADDTATGRAHLRFPTVPGSRTDDVMLITMPQQPEIEVTTSLESLAQQAGLASRAITANDLVIRERAERRFKALIDNAGDIVTVLDAHGRISFVSPAAHRLLGYPNGTLEGRHWESLVHPDDAEDAESVVNHHGPGIEIKIRHATGTFHWFEVSARDLSDDPDIAGFVVTARHIGDRKRAELLLQRSESRFRALVQHSSDVVIVVDSAGIIEYASPAVEDLLGLQTERAVGISLMELVTGDRLAALLETMNPEDLAVTVEAETLWSTPTRVIEFTMSDLREQAGVEGIVLNGRDVTERRSLEQTLRHQALHDDLTGLPNRTMLMNEMDAALSSDDDLPVALLFLDLDDFKDVNDSLGHEAGDALLVTIAERIVRSVRHGDTAARIGGDEFAVLVPSALGESSVIELADRIISEIAQPMLIGGRAVNCNVSVGVAIDHDHSATPEILLRNADVAMYRAKDRGKGRTELYEEHLHTSVFHRFELKNDLQRGLDNGELLVVYQPLIDMRTTRIRGAEALVRWQHPTKGLLSPIDFIPVAEASGMIVELGSQVLNTAAEQLARWDRELAPDMRMSVNVSVRQLESGTLIDEVQQVIRSSGINPAQLCLEITETVFMSDPVGTAAQFVELRQLGVKIAIDDFGTGYSSLRHVQEYPFDVLKIDKSFVDRVDTSEHGSVIRTIMRLADDLHATTVAEGIEHAGQVRALRALGCDFGQGFYFARPVSPERFDELVRTELNAELGHDAR